MGGHDVDGVALGGTAWWLLRTQRGRSDEHDTAEHHEPTGLHQGLLSEVRGTREAAHGKGLLTPLVTRGPVDSTIPRMAAQGPMMFSYTRGKDAARRFFQIPSDLVVKPCALHNTLDISTRYPHGVS
jgi:hypothetical protein